MMSKRIKIINKKIVHATEAYVQSHKQLPRDDCRKNIVNVHKHIINNHQQHRAMHSAFISGGVGGEKTGNEIFSVNSIKSITARERVKYRICKWQKIRLLFLFHR